MRAPALILLASLVLLPALPATAEGEADRFPEILAKLASADPTARNLAVQEIQTRTGVWYANVEQAFAAAAADPEVVGRLRTSALAQWESGRSELATLAVAMEIASRETEPSIHQPALRALETITTYGSTAVPALVLSLRHGEAGVRKWATAALGRICSEPEAQPFASPWPGYPFVWDSTIRVYPNPHWRPPRTGRPDHDLRATVAASLAAGLRDPETAVRRETANALGRIGSAAAPALPAIRAAIETVDAETAGKLGDLLPRIGVTALPALCEMLESDQPKTRVRVIRAIAGFMKENPGTVKVVAKGLSDPDQEVREFTVGIFRGKGPLVLPALPELIAALADEGDFVSWQAAQAIGEIGPAAKDAIPALLEALDHEYVQTGIQAALAIVRIDPSRKEEATEAMLRFLAGRYDGGRGAAARILLEMDADPNLAVPALRMRLEDPDEEVRVTAARFLYEFGRRMRDRAFEQAVHALRESESLPDVAALEATVPPRTLGVRALLKSLGGRNKAARGNAALNLRWIVEEAAETPDTRPAWEDLREEIVAGLRAVAEDPYEPVAKEARRALAALD